MRIEWRMIAAVAGAAFVLSALVGVIGGVSFGVLLLRALVIAAVFAGGSLGVGFAVDHFLPELHQSTAAAGEKESGGTVDIVVDDDLLTDDSLSAQLPEETADNSEDVDDAAELAQAGDDESTDEGELLAEESPATGTFSPGIQATEVGSSGSEEEEVEELAEDTDAEALPDMDRMSGSFVAPPEAGESAGPEESGSTGGDPSIMARAIQTVLKREEA